MSVFAPPLSLTSLFIEDGLGECADLQASVIKLYTSYEVTLPSLGCGLCVERSGFVYCVPSSAGKPQGIHPSSQNQKVSITALGGIIYRGMVV